MRSVVASRPAQLALRSLTLMLVCVAWSVMPAHGGERHYTVDATLEPATRTITGTVQVRFTNTATTRLREIALVLYPNRFAADERGINDLNRPYVYPREEHVPGGVTIEALEVRSGGDAEFRPVGAERYEDFAGWRETLLRAAVPSPIAPGERATVRATFRIVFPERFGPFGIANGTVTALGGWFPTLPALPADGAWDATRAVPPAMVDGTLRTASTSTIVVGSQVVPTGHEGRVDFAIASARWPMLAASDEYVVHHRDVDGTDVVLLELPPRYGHRFPPSTSHAELMLDAIERILKGRPEGMPPLPPRLVVVEAPLRLELTAPSRPGIAIVSDRTLRVHRLIRPFHERELAAAVYAAMLRERIDEREHEDAGWVAEGVAAELADRYVAANFPRQRTVGDWIALFNVFAIVDRFESAAKIPFADVFFPQRRGVSELRDGIESFARDRPPGRTIFGKLRNEIGDAQYAEAIRRYLANGETFRETAAHAHGETLDWLFEQWVAPYPKIDYALGDPDLNRATSVARDAAADSQTGETYAHVVPVMRRASRPVREAVDIDLIGVGGHRERFRWPGRRQEADLHLETPWPVRRVVLDPDRRLLEDSRVDNERPRPLQVVLDSADVTVTSSEFGMSGLFVARQRYDYTKDVGLIGFLSDRSVGMHVGPRFHFGERIDPTLYRHNVYGFYTLAALRGDFRDDSRPQRGDDGVLSGVGLRYDYTDEFAFDNPTATTKVRLFGDWYTAGLGSSYDYLDWGARISLARPIVTPRTLVALQVLNAFSTPIDGDRVPNQGRYSLGGDLAIRGIPVDERLGENIALIRAELRQTIYPETDFNLMDWLVIRRGQLRLFVDSGRVEDRRSSLYRFSDFAVGVGIGAAMVYDFMGFYPAVAYVAVAQRVDRFDGVDNQPQVLFGTRQAF